MRRPSGNATIEFVLLAPLLFLMTFGIIEWGWHWRSQSLVVMAAHEGTRKAVGVGSSGSLQADGEAAARLFLEGMGIAAADITVTSTYDGNVPGQFLIDVRIPTGSVTGLVPVPNQVHASQLAVIPF